MSPLNKNLDEKRKLHRKLNAVSHRLLTKYKQDKDSNISIFKEITPNNKAKRKKCISNNKKGANRKYKKSYKSSLYVQEYGKNIQKNKCNIPKTKQYSNYEKKIFKELDYKDYLKNIKIIENKEYKKVARKKRRVRMALLLLFFSVLIVPILDLSLVKLTDGGLLGFLGLLTTKTVDNSVIPKVEVGGILNTLFNMEGLSESRTIYAINVLFYCVPFLIFVVIFILGMVYYYKKVIKYENIKFRKRLNKK
ncbi:Plasmodium exported protein (Pm-fam-a like), unknown function [Plasmodium malariae]|uniref:Fam-l protein n=1 Tax=Plasmodium malariae TaxID=5858 RepID=A0A1A8X5L3_PLAMA|nr:Plasmodium exported protein (Pm-fam-a like), unknown function [Plasmodium malariae]